MIVNGTSLLLQAPILNMETSKLTGPGGTSYGLGEAGYDIRIKQAIKFRSGWPKEKRIIEVSDNTLNKRLIIKEGRFVLASAIEEFDMPTDLVGVVHDKSTWARRGLSVFNTVIEPGWKGHLTLELVYHGEGDLIIPAGSGIAQVVFTRTTDTARYTGKYQNQEDFPVAARDSK